MVYEEECPCTYYLSKETPKPDSAVSVFLVLVLYMYFPIVKVAELRYGCVHEDRESLSFIVDLVFERSLVNDFSANAAYM